MIIDLTGMDRPFEHMREGIAAQYRAIGAPAADASEIADLAIHASAEAFTALFRTCAAAHDDRIAVAVASIALQFVAKHAAVITGKITAAQEADGVSHIRVNFGG